MMIVKISSNWKWVLQVLQVQISAMKVQKFDNDHDPRRAIQGYLFLANLTSTREPIVVCGLVGLIVGAGVSSSPAKIGDLKT